MFRLNPITGVLSFVPEYAPPGPPGDVGDPGYDGEPGPQGPQGEPGERGEQGQRGERGESGNDGLDGLGILSGTAPPSPLLGSPGQFYIDYIHWTIYGPKGLDGWPMGVSMIGPQGEPGYDGVDGDPGERGERGDPGFQGPPGKEGPPGPPGKPGPAGPPGRVYHTNESGTTQQRGWIPSGITVQNS